MWGNEDEKYRWATRQDAAHGRVRRGDANAAPRQLQRLPHPILVLFDLLIHRAQMYQSEM
jgi:hypothetical protein